jgi:hypothetical protein
MAEGGAKNNCMNLSHYYYKREFDFNINKLQNLLYINQLWLK